MTRKRSKPSKPSKKSKRDKRKRSVSKASPRAIRAAKTSPAQLDREIAAALSRHRSRRHHSTLAKGFAAIPSVVVE